MSFSLLMVEFTDEWSYSKGILAEILDFVIGKELIPSDGEIWRRRRHANVPALHQKYVAAMIALFGEASDRLCQKLDSAASKGFQLKSWIKWVVMEDQYLVLNGSADTCK